MGGADAALKVARHSYAEGDYRWVAEVCKHVLFADDSHTAAKTLLADALEQLGFGAENGTWRSAYLAGAKELREGKFGTPATAASADIMGALTVPQVFDSIAVRIDGPKAWDQHLAISWVITDLDTTYLTELRNGALNHRVVAAPVPGTTTFTLTRPTLIAVVTGAADLASCIADATVTVDGDAAQLASLVGLLAPVDPNFAIVTP